MGELGTKGFECKMEREKDSGHWVKKSMNFIVKTWYAKIKSSSDSGQIGAINVLTERHTYNKTDKMCPESTEALCYWKKHGV